MNENDSPGTDPASRAAAPTRAPLPHHLDPTPANPPLAGWVHRALAGASDLPDAIDHPDTRAFVDHDVRAAVRRDAIPEARDLLLARAPLPPHERLDERDPWCAATRELARTLALDEAELRALRFCDVARRSPALLHLLLIAVSTGPAGEHAVAARLGAITGVDATEVRRTLGLRGSLRRRGLMPAMRPNTLHSLGELIVPVREVADWLDAVGEDDAADVPRPFVDRLGPARFGLEAWPHLLDATRDAARYLASSLEAGAAGANLLLWGPPGTGKTELARTLVAAAGAEAFGVRFEDREGAALDANERLASRRLSAAVAVRTGGTVLVLDEAEDVLGTEAARRRTAPDDRASKAAVNAALETVPVPCLWIANSVAGVDAAYLRRFDLTLRVPPPPPRVRLAMLEGALDGLAVAPATARAIAARSSVAPADLARAARVVERTGAVATGRADALLRRTVDAGLRARGEPPLVPAAPSRLGPPDGSLACPDRDAERVLAMLAPDVGVRLAFVGPRGAGKSTWLDALAERAGRTVLRCDWSALADDPFVPPLEGLRAFLDAASERGAIAHVERLEGRFGPDPDALPGPEGRLAAGLIEAVGRHAGTIVLESRDELLERGTLPSWLDDRVGFGPVAPARAARAVAALCAGSDDVSTGCIGDDAVPQSPVRYDARAYPGDLVAVERRLILGTIERRPEAVVRALHALATLHRATGDAPMGFVVPPAGDGQGSDDGGRGR